MRAFLGRYARRVSFLIICACFYSTCEATQPEPTSLDVPTSQAGKNDPGQSELNTRLSPEAEGNGETIAESRRLSSDASLKRILKNLGFRESHSTALVQDAGGGGGVDAQLQARIAKLISTQISRAPSDDSLHAVKKTFHDLKKISQPAAMTSLGMVQDEIELDAAKVSQVSAVEELKGSLEALVDAAKRIRWSGQEAKRATLHLVKEFDSKERLKPLEEAATTLAELDMGQSDGADVENAATHDQTSSESAKQRNEGKQREESIAKLKVIFQSPFFVPAGQEATKDFSHAFDFIDADKNGLISQEEFKEALKSHAKDGGSEVTLQEDEIKQLATEVFADLAGDNEKMTKEKFLETFANQAGTSNALPKEAAAIQLRQEAQPEEVTTVEEAMPEAFLAQSSKKQRGVRPHPGST